MPLMAVLTGDLIKSQCSSNTDEYIEALKTTIKKLQSRFAIEEWSQFRGDGFQIVPHSPTLAFHCAVALRAGLIAASPSKERWDARISIGLGEKETHHGYGEAFVLSGQGLDSMKKSTFSVHSKNKKLLEKLELATDFAAAIIDSWTQVEAETYYIQTTLAANQQTTAESLRKSRVTINKALQRGHAKLIDRYLDRCQAWITETINDRP